MLKNTLLNPRKSDAQEPETSEQQSSVLVSTGGEANQHTLRNIGLITGREYKNRVTQRSYIISTVVILVLVVIAAFVPTIIQVIAAKSNSQTRVAIMNNAGNIGSLNENALESYIATNLNGTSGQNTNGQPPFVIMNPSDQESLSAAQQQVKKGSIDILLVINRTANQDLSFTYYTSSSNSGNESQIQTIVGQLSTLDKASRLGLTPAQTTSLFTPPAFTVVSTSQNTDTRSAGDIVAGIILAYAGIVLIFMSVFLYGMGVAQGVAEEKGSRIMEILVNAATPFQLMVGKILGIGAAGLTQMAAFVCVGILALLLQTPLQNAILGKTTGVFTLNITGASITLLVLLLVYFILGFLLYASLFAAMGALVKRQDEVQNAVQPITWLFMVGYFVSFFGISNPNATWVRIVSYVPFWTPTTMLMRIGAGAAAPWEIALTIVLMILAAIGCMFISARIYRFGVLMYGQRPGLGQLIRMVGTR